MYSQTEQYTAMVVNIQCEYMSCFACKNQTSKLDKENIEWAIKKEQSRETGNIWYSSCILEDTRVQLIYTVKSVKVLAVIEERKHFSLV